MMAQALMRYETIDSRQIDQIMEGREPDPPEGWTEGDSGKPARAKPAETGDGRSTIGGPAEQL
ncbi:ATP-dependent zinc metalloprotease FtsH [compost metagenome]